MLWGLETDPDQCWRTWTLWSRQAGHPGEKEMKMENDFLKVYVCVGGGREEGGEGADVSPSP